MYPIITNDEKDEPPFATILNLVRELIQRLRKAAKWRIVFALVGCAMGTGILIWALSQGALTNLGPAGAAMIVLSGVFYGTISLAFLLGILDRNEKRSLAESIQREFSALANSDKASQHKKFEERFYDILKAIF